MEAFVYNQYHQFKSMVYRNLHQQCWSVKALEGPHRGRTVLHAAQLIVDRPQFKVSAAGRARVIQTKQKNVHAGVVGYVTHAIVQDERYQTNPTIRVMASTALLSSSMEYSSHKAYREVTYNPYKFETFVFAATHEPVTLDTGDTAIMNNDGKVFTESHKLMNLLMLSIRGCSNPIP